MSSPVFYMQDTLTKQWVTSIIPSKDGPRAVYFGPAPGVQRWITQKGAATSLEKLKRDGTNPPGIADRLTIIMVK